SSRKIEFRGTGVLACATLKLKESPQRSENRGFPKSRRLLRHADFERVYKRGRRHFATHMTAFYLRREGEPGESNLRIGFTVGKVLGGAVQRNRMKRRVRPRAAGKRSEEHTSELQSQSNLVCRLLLEKK